jgi:hypothetical protein
MAGLKRKFIIILSPLLIFVRYCWNSQEVMMATENLWTVLSKDVLLPSSKNSGLASSGSRCAIFQDCSRKAGSLLAMALTNCHERGSPTHRKHTRDQ